MVAISFAFFSYSAPAKVPPSGPEVKWNAQSCVIFISAAHSLLSANRKNPAYFLLNTVVTGI